MKANLMLIRLWILSVALIFTGVMLLNAVVFNLGLGLLTILLVVTFIRMFR
jgi:hypothetical protein